MAEFTSSLEIDKKIQFIPMEKHCQEFSIKKESLCGVIIAVKFTKAKVFYDIVDDYWGILFTGVDSANIICKKIEKLKEEESQNENGGL